MSCPLYTNKLVFDEFNGIVELLGGKPLTLEEFLDSALRNLRTGLDYSAMEAAYTIYDKNNGNPLDKAPNGNTSILYQTLLDLNGGDVIAASKQKATVYSNQFIDWFGDWANDPTNSSKVVDKNGEPLVVYRGSLATFDVFDVAKNNKGKKGFFFTDSRTMASSYGSTTAFFLNCRSPYIVDANGKNWNNINAPFSIIAKDKLDAIRLHRNNLLLSVESGNTTLDIYDFFNNKYYKYLDEYNTLGDGILDKIKKYIIKNKLNDFDSDGELIKSTRNAESVLEYGVDDVSIVFESVVDYGSIFNLDASKALIQKQPANVFVTTDATLIKHISNKVFKKESSNIYDTAYELGLTKLFERASFGGLFGQSADKLISGETVSTTELVQQMLDNSVIDPFNVKLALLLARHDIPMKAMALEDYVIATTITEKDGGSAIIINKNALSQVSSRYASEKILHEIVHAITVGAINNPVTALEKAFAKANSKMYKAFSAAFPANMFNRNDPYDVYRALTNEKEFAAEFMTNRQVRDFFRKQAVILDSNAKTNGILQVTKDFINKLSLLFVNEKLFKNNQEQLAQYEKLFNGHLNNVPTAINGNITSKQLLDLLNAVEDPQLTSNEHLMNIIDSFIYQYLNFERNNAAFTISEKHIDLARSNINRKMTEAEAEALINKTCKTISDYLSKRLMSVSVSKLSKPIKTRLSQTLNGQIEQFKNSENNKWYVIQLFIVQLLPQLLSDESLVRKLKESRSSKKSDSFYYYNKHDNFGTYSVILRDLEGLLSIDSVLNVLLDLMLQDPDVTDGTKDDILDLLSRIRSAKLLADDGLKAMDTILISNLTDRIASHANRVGDIDLLGYIKELETIGFDSSDYIRTFGRLDLAKDKGLNMLFNLINTANQEADRAFDVVATELLDAQRKLKFDESMQELYEKDINGVKTQYLVRSRNYGQFFLDYAEAMRQINRKFGILDENNRIPPSDPEIAKGWNDARNAWLNIHCDRPYKDVYYEAYSKLSADTQQRRSEILNEIHQIKLLALGDDGYYHFEKLSKQQWQRLNSFYHLKRQLALLYDMDGQLKTGDELRIALEIQEFNNTVFPKKEMVTDKKRWLEEREKILRECGGKEELLKGKEGNFNWTKWNEWNDRNTRVQLKKDGDDIALFKFIESIAPKPIYEVNDDNGAAYDEINEKLKALKNQFRQIGTGEIDPKNMSEAVLFEIRRLEKEKSRIVSRAIKTNKQVRKLHNEYVKTLKKYVNFEWTDLYSRLYEKARKEDLRNRPDVEDLALDELDLDGPVLKQFKSNTGRYISSSIDDDLGLMIFRPYSWFTKMVVKPQYRDQFVEELPGDGWIDTDVSDQLKNPNFDETEHMSMVPKMDYSGNNELLKENVSTIDGKKLYTYTWEEDKSKSALYKKHPRRYDNTKLYNRITKERKATLGNLYDTVLRIMHQSNEMQENRLFTDDYLLPSIKGNVFNRMKHQSMRNAANIFWGWFKDKIGVIDEDDVDFGQNPKLFLEKATEENYSFAVNNGNQIYSGAAKNQRPDGSPLRMVMLPYTKKLKNSYEVSEDLLYIIGEYYKTSVRFKNKSEIKDLCESMVDMMGNREYMETSSSVKKLFKYLKNTTKQIIDQLKFNEESLLSLAITPTGQLSNTYHTARKFLDMNLYNIRMDGSKLRIGNWSLMKFLLLFSGLTTTINLGLNIAVAGTGFTTALFAHIVQSITGYNYDNSSSFRAARTVLGHYITTVLGAETLFNLNTRDKVMVLMLGYNTADLSSKKLKDSNVWRPVSVIKNNVNFGMLTGLGFVVKSNILLSVMMDYHYVDGRFMTKTDITNLSWNKSAQWKKDMLKKWKSGKSLYDVIDTSRGVINIPEQYREAYKDAENRVHSKVVKFAEAADGMATETQKSAISTTWYGMLMLIHRQYLPLMLSERFGETVWDEDTQQYSGGHYRIAFNLIRNGFMGEDSFFNNVMDELNLETKNGKIKTKYYENSTDYNLASKANRAAFKRKVLKQMLVEQALYHGLIHPATMLLLAYSQDDKHKKDKLLQLLAYIMSRTMWETYTPYRFDDLFNNFKSPSAALGLTDRLGLVAEGIASGTIQGFKSVIDLIHAALSGTFEESKPTNNKVQRGVYQGWYKTERDLFKILPAHNAYEQILDSKSKNNYYMRQIMHIDNEDLDPYKEILNDLGAL